MITRKCPWQDDRPEAPITWRLASYGDDDGTIYCDRYGDGEDEIVCPQDLPSVEDCREAYRRYYRYVIKTATDPLNEFWHCTATSSKSYDFVARFEKILDSDAGQFLAGCNYQAGLAEVRQNGKVVFPTDTWLRREIAERLSVVRGWLPVNYRGKGYFYLSVRSWTELEAIPGAKVSAACVTLQFRMTLPKLLSEKEGVKRLRKAARAELLSLAQGGGPFLC